MVTTPADILVGYLLILVVRETSVVTYTGRYSIGYNSVMAG